ncbi:hypothetical protein BH09PLA1_BH09PLA1_30570 [soil metagenome]
MSRVIYYAPLIALLVWAAMVDYRSRRVPNWISFGLVLGGIGLSLLPWGIISAKQAAFGFAVGFVLPVALYSVGAIGAGDVKLVAGVGAWIGPVPVLLTFAGAALIGMVFAIVKSAQQGRLRDVLRDSMLLSTNVARCSLADIARVDVAREDVDRAEVMQPTINRAPAAASNRLRERTLPFAVAIAASTIAVVLVLSGSAGR